MSGLLQRQEAYFLGKLQQAEKRQLSRSQLMRIPTAVEQFDSLDADTAQRVRDMLVEKEYIEEIHRGWGVSYRLSKSGEEHLSTLAPHRRFAPKKKPEINNALLPYQRAFLLMQFLRNEDRRLTRSRLLRALNVKDAREKLKFAKQGKGASDRRELDKVKVDWLIDHLLETGALRETHRGSLFLTETGEEILGATDHCPEIRVSMTGAELNQLMEMARNTGADLTVDKEETTAAADSDA